VNRETDIEKREKIFDASLLLLGVALIVIKGGIQPYFFSVVVGAFLVLHGANGFRKRAVKKKNMDELVYSIITKNPKDIDEPDEIIREKEHR
jgi:hypothetical protein